LRGGGKSLMLSWPEPTTPALPQMETTYMHYDLRRLDGDPTYAPGRVFNHGKPVWRPPGRDVKAGFAIRHVKLDGTEAEQAAKCRELARELLRWREGVPKVQPLTWAWIIGRYKDDELSKYHDLKPNTRKSYDEQFDGWLKSTTVAETLVGETTFETLMRWKRAMEKNGRSISFIKKRFTHLSIVANYGLALKPSAFRDVCSILTSGALNLRTPRPRQVFPTPDQIAAVIAAADAAGNKAFALGLSLQWWLTLRAVDVRGQWFGDRWADGLTWDMVDLDQMIIRKMVSKTERHDDRPMVWDLSPLPDLVARLRAIPQDQRVGAVVKVDGVPFKVRHYAALWRKFARKAGVPDEVWMMDTRSGAINEALSLGADRTALQHAANHKDGSTTERYIRAREVGANKVIQMRARS
jgi:hypothetical protein